MSQTGTTGREESLPDAQSAAGRRYTDESVKQVAKYTYDFAKLGGVVNTTLYLDGPEIPANAIVTNGYMRVITAVVGSGASLAVSLVAANDIQTAAAVSGAPWSTTGLKDAQPEPGTEGGYLTTTARCRVYVAISAAALTAGKFHVVLEYDLVK
jgi:hypothetical protein